MLFFAGHEKPWLKRLDHLICDVPDIDEAVSLFEKLDFPIVWPVGRYWPQRRTAGIALGGINLEFIQLDEGAPDEPKIRTLVFEAIDIEHAADKLINLGSPMHLTEKWEPNPEILKLRGFNESECHSPQLICRNAYPELAQPFDFFLCTYAPALHERLGKEAFPGLPPVSSITLGCPTPLQDWSVLAQYWGLPMKPLGCEINISETPHSHAEVIEIISDRGPIDLQGWTSRFRFT